MCENNPFTDSRTITERERDAATVVKMNDEIMNADAVKMLAEFMRADMVLRGLDD